MSDLKGLIEARNIYDEGEWSANITLENGFFTEISIKGDESGVFESYFSRAEKVLAMLPAYEKLGLSYLQKYIPDNEENPYEIFTITVGDFVHGEIEDAHYAKLFKISDSDFLLGQYSEKKTYSDGFIITFFREFNETEPYLFKVRFVPSSSGELEFTPISLDVNRY